MRFRKLPVVIEAFQFIVGNNEIPVWFRQAMSDGKIWFQGGENPYLSIQTLEGVHRANLGDWIIQGVKGELYPCKPDIFAITYEAE